MVIALLALLGVNLIVLVVLLVAVVGRKRWVSRQPDVFQGRARSVSGKVDGLRPKWRRGYGRWVRDILVWTKGPFYFWNVILPLDRSEGDRPAEPDELRRLGEDPLVMRLRSGEATVEVAARGKDRGLLLGPDRSPVDDSDDVGLGR